MMLRSEIEQEELDYERGAEMGDPRRCQRHGTVISSPDGMFDGLCGSCEAEMDAYDHDDEPLTLGDLHLAVTADHDERPSREDDDFPF